jgi:aspartate-semialdehyde dehydrogenase
MTDRIEVGLLGATGMVGQQFISYLQGHPWFDLTWLAASERSEGRRYADAASWRLEARPPDGLANRLVQGAVPGRGPRLVFSALDAGVAGEIEEAFAAAGHLVVSNARNHRLDPAVPLLVPEVNADHLALAANQRAAKQWPGVIVTNPNCSTVVLTLALAPLRAFGLRACVGSTMQAVSGAGYPGVPSFDILGNVIPFISGEEQKIETETKKILGAMHDGRVELHPVVVSAHTSRVPVLDGHTETVSVSLDRKVDAADMRAAFDGFAGPPQELGLPSAPARPIVYLDEPNRPQPRFDAMRDRGMTVTVGRLRHCPVLDWKFVALGHNTIRGAAGAAVLNAELVVAKGWLD